MAEKFAEGGETARDAFQTVVKALGEMEDPIAQNEAGVNLFGKDVLGKTTSRT